MSDSVSPGTATTKPGMLVILMGRRVGVCFGKGGRMRGMTRLAWRGLLRPNVLASDFEKDCGGKEVAMRKRNSKREVNERRVGRKSLSGRGEKTGVDGVTGSGREEGFTVMLRRLSSLCGSRIEKCRSFLACVLDTLPAAIHYCLLVPAGHPAAQWRCGWSLPSDEYAHRSL